MEDPELNRDLAEVTELKQRWTQFNDFFNMAKDASTTITPDAERKFLELKTRIALLHESFMKRVQHDKSIAQNVINTVGATIMLRQIRNMSPTEQQKIEYDWNESFMLMNETVAHTEEAVAELANVSATGYRMRRIQSAVQQQIQLFLGSTKVKIAAIATVLLLALIILPVLGVYDYRFVKRVAPPLVGPYNTVANQMRSFMPDIAYADFEEIPLGMTIVVDAGDRPAMEEMNKNNFLRQLATIGFAVADVDRAMELAKDVQYRGLILRDLKERNRVFAHQLLFPETSQAKQFVQLWQESLARLQDPDERERVKREVIVGRRANFVLITEATGPEAQLGFHKLTFSIPENQIYGGGTS